MLSMLRAVVGSFTVLRNRNFRIYLGGQAISLIGTWLQVAAQAWVVWNLTHSTVPLGITGMLGTLPLLVLAPWTGTWADRYNRRKLLIGTQIGAMLLAFILSALVLTNTVQLWHVYVLSLMLGIITALDMPTQQAFLGDLAGTEEVRKAINLNVMIVQVSRLLGPALAGAIIALLAEFFKSPERVFSSQTDPELLGAGMAFFLNGLSFIAVVISLMLVNKVKLSFTPHKHGNALRGFGEALQFIKDRPTLMESIAFVMLLTFFAMSIVLNILPAVATTVLHGDASTLGILMSASGAGALVGTILLAPWAQTLRRTGVMLAIGTMCSAMSFMLLAASNILPLSMAALFIAGLSAPPVFTTVMGLLQFNSPPEMRARVMSLFIMVSFGLQPIAALWIGWSADRFGVQQAILLNAVLLLIGAAIMLSRSSLRNWKNVQPLPIMPIGEAGD